MNTKTQLLQYQQEMEEIEKKAQRMKGSLDVAYQQLKTELSAAKKETKVEELLPMAKKEIQALTKEVTTLQDELEALMEEIAEEYEAIENDTGV